jgi:hypothetical protein
MAASKAAWSVVLRVGSMVAMTADLTAASKAAWSAALTVARTASSMVAMKAALMVEMRAETRDKHWVEPTADLKAGL